MTELSDLAARFAGAQRSGPRDRQHGVYSGIVTDVLDPLRLGRVRVQVSGFNECDLPWARVALPMAGAGRGAFGSPRLGDEVLVAFEGGDPRQPYVIGFLWSARNTPPQDATPLQEYAVRGAAGGLVEVAEARTVTIRLTGGPQVVVSDAGVDIVTGSSTVSVTPAGVTVTGTEVTLQATSSLTLLAEGQILLNAPTVAVVGEATTTVQGGELCAVTAALVTIN